jgi:hypothetical protein
VYNKLHTCLQKISKAKTKTGRQRPVSSLLSRRRKKNQNQKRQTKIRTIIKMGGKDTLKKIQISAASR